jgi:hypothetical protein
LVSDVLGRPIFPTQDRPLTLRLLLGCPDPDRHSVFDIVSAFYLFFWDFLVVRSSLSRTDRCIRGFFLMSGSRKAFRLDIVSAFSPFFWDFLVVRSSLSRTDPCICGFFLCPDPERHSVLTSYPLCFTHCSAPSPTVNDRILLSTYLESPSNSSPVSLHFLRHSWVKWI